MLSVETAENKVERAKGFSRGQIKQEGPHALFKNFQGYFQKRPALFLRGQACLFALLIIGDSPCRSGPLAFSRNPCFSESNAVLQSDVGRCS